MGLPMSAGTQADGEAVQPTGCKPPVRCTAAP